MPDSTAARVAYLVGHRESWWGKDCTIDRGKIFAGMRRRGLVSAGATVGTYAFDAWIEKARAIVTAERSAVEWREKCEAAEAQAERLMEEVERLRVAHAEHHALRAVLKPVPQAPPDPVEDYRAAVQQIEHLVDWLIALADTPVSAAALERRRADLATLRTRAAVIAERVQPTTRKREGAVQCDSEQRSLRRVS